MYNDHLVGKWSNRCWDGELEILRGCPRKNRPSNFWRDTEFLQIFFARQLVYMMNKNSNSLVCSAFY